MGEIIPQEIIEKKIYFIRNLKVMLDKDLVKRLDEMERKYDAQFKIVFEAIRQLMAPAEKKKQKIGFERGIE